jgi:predicted kinase
VSKVSITVGIPGSGKTHVAKLMHADNPDDVLLISRDGLRAELFNGEGILTPAEEAYISKVQKSIVKDALRAGKHVIIHDMNLREKYRKDWAKIASNHGAEFDIIDLTSTALAVCVGRNMVRAERGERYVPNNVIADLHHKFIKPLQGRPVVAPEINAKARVDWVEYTPNLNLPTAIIVDLDGTTALCEGVRSPYDYTRVKFDKPNLAVIKHVQDEAYKLGTKILFVSGRLARDGINDQVYKDTEEWLYEHVKVPIELLAMRDRDGIDDTVIKYEIFNKHIRDWYNVKYALDDRNRVVGMWRSIDLLCLQVAEGDF